MEITFNNKKVLVTGAGQGIGRDLVKKLVECGANVVALSKTEVYLKTLKEEVPSITTVVCDVTDTKKVRELVAANGPYHCLVNNAAVALLEPFLDASEDAFDRSFSANVKSAFVISQVVAKMMIDNQIKGTIVNISSQASQMAIRNHAVYCATKGALDILSKVMALELGGHGIRVNCVNPTVVMTNMGRIGWADPAKAKPMLDRIPLHKFAEVEDVVNAIIFLLSDLSNMINAVTLPVDGGALAN